jgi:hypothetical protein
MKDILPSLHEYIIPPLSEDQARNQASQQLLAFMSMSPGGDKFFKA